MRFIGMLLVMLLLNQVGDLRAEVRYLENDSTTINFLPRGIGKSKVKIKINKLLVGELESYDHLKCKIEHRDTILIEYEVWGSKKQFLAKLNADKEHFFMMPKTSLEFRSVDAEEWKKSEEKIKRTYFFNESITEKYNFIKSPSDPDEPVEPGHPDFREVTELKFYSDIKGVASVYINGKLIESINHHEELLCKVYSEGRVTINIIGDNAYKRTAVLDIKPKEANYIFIRYNISIGDRDDWLLIKNKITKTLRFEERKSNPIGDIPDEVFTSKQGSGFLIDREGYVVTNAHVVVNSNKIFIRGINGDYQTKLEAIPIAIDASNDLALLKITSKLVRFMDPPYAISNSLEVNQGEDVFAMGYPRENILGKEIKVTDGIVSAKSGLFGDISRFQFSAPIQPGNSGGPLFNKSGDVIGVATEILNRNLGEASYAIKSNYLTFFLSQIDGFDYKGTINTLGTNVLSEQVKVISDFVFIVETE